MKFHPDKCKVLRVGRDHPPFDYTMSDASVQCALEEVIMEKDLGITIDNQLTFQTHCSNMVSNASRNLAIIRRTFQHLDEETLIPLYKTLVRSHLEYGVDVWSPKLKKDIHSIESVQRRATKLVPGLAGLSYQERLTKLKLPSMVYRRKRGEMIQVFKFLHNIWNIEDENFLPPAIDNRTRGHSLKLFKRRTMTTVRSHFFCNRVIDLWNELPEDVTQAPSVNAFKALDSFWSDKAWLYDYEAD